MLRQIAFFLGFTLFFTQLLSASQTLTMTYRTTAKEPFINEAPSDEGIWKSVYEKAAKKIGFELKIERYPKKRAYSLLAIGDVDFYPSSSFNLEREKMGYFIKNHLSREGVAILYRDDLNISNIEDIKGYELLNNLGSTTIFYKRAKIDLTTNIIREVPELSIEKAIELLQRKMADVYAYSDVGIESFLGDKKIKGIKKIILSSKGKTSVLIFSKKSPHYKEKSNPAYNPNERLSLSNLPYTLDKNSTAYKFQQALYEMKKSGEIDAILNSYGE